MPESRAPIPFIDLAAQQRIIRGRIDAAIARVLDHGQYIMGPEIGELERELAAFCGARRFASRCASGTDALLIAMMAHGIGFLATPSSAPPSPIQRRPRRSRSWAQRQCLSTSKRGDLQHRSQEQPAVIDGSGSRIRAVGLITVDLFGLPADYPALREFAHEHGLWVLADAAQSFGASWAGARRNLWRRHGHQLLSRQTARLLRRWRRDFHRRRPPRRDHGQIRLHGKGADKYDIVRIGVNGRLDTLQAAILLEKLEIFGDELAARQRVAQRYTEGLADSSAVPAVPAGAQSAWAQYTIRVPGNRRGPSAKALQAEGVPTNIYYPAAASSDSVPGLSMSPEGLPVAERLSQEALSLPMHPYLVADVPYWIIASVRRALLLSPS